jgi:glutamine cyclotransferase
MSWIVTIVIFASALFAQKYAAYVAPPELYVPRIHEVYPHDPDSFTQGLVWHEGTFYESAGLYGESDVRQVDPETGEVLRERPVDAEFFAEGLALVDDRLIQITWQEFKAFVYDRDTFEPVDEFTYDTEGWGLCYDGARLVMSDGTANLYFRDPETFELLDTIEVRVAGQPQMYLNELECVGDRVYANIWTTDYILIIDPSNGRTEGVIYAGELLTPEEASSGADVLNGIAYNPETERFYITGKKWPKLFEVTFEEFQP